MSREAFVRGTAKNKTKSISLIYLKLTVILFRALVLLSGHATHAVDACPTKVYY